MIPLELLTEILSYGFCREIVYLLPEKIVMNAASRVIKGLSYNESLYLLLSHRDSRLEDMCSLPPILKYHLSRRRRELKTLDNCLHRCEQYDNAETLDIVLSHYSRSDFTEEMFYGCSPKLICVYAKYMSVDYNYLLHRSSEEGYFPGIKLALRYLGNFESSQEYCLRKTVSSGNIECVKLLLERIQADPRRLILYSKSREMSKFLSMLI